MIKVTSTIEINGNRYDAVSGRLIGAVKQAAYQALKPTQGLSIDGFTRRAAQAGDRAKRSVHGLKRRPDRSKTLMRAALKKPAGVKSNDRIKTRGLSPDHARADRARRVTQSSKVQRFGRLPFTSRSEAKTGEIVKKTEANSGVGVSAMAIASQPSIVTTSASHHKLERLLDYALAHADAHKKSLDQGTRSRSKFFDHWPRWLSISVLILVAIALTGFVVWRLVPAASFRLAAAKAHVNASLPTPISGYKIGPIASRDNAVITTILSTSDSSKKYVVTEQALNQPTASLAANAVSGGTGSSPQVQTVQDQDKTYVLSQDKNKNMAACTKGANTVSVEGSDLNVAQLLEAAKNACKN